MSARRSQPTALPECDLVLKAGVTSGVVYLGAIVELGRKYRFRNVGGTSSGAIAATFAAAAEFHRQKHGGDGLAGPMAGVREQLLTRGFQAGIFQPAPSMRPMLQMLLHAVHDGWARWRRGLAIVALLLSSRWWAALPALACGAGLMWLVFAHLPLAAALFAALAVALTAFAIAVAVAAGLVAFSAKRFLDDPRNGFGICSGRSQPGAAFPGVTDWLHEAVQRIAGMPADQPLTFADLKRCSVQVALNVIAANVTRGLPVTLPLATAGEYRFSLDDMSRLFPKEIACHLRAHSEDSADGLRALPADELPVVVAARLSLAFPLLISAVPLYDADGRLNWFSDGGVCSNFPVHLFDAWLPSRPTFGLDLEPYDGKLAFAKPNGSGANGGLVTMTTGDDEPAPRWTNVDSVTVFVRQVADVMQNWRDNAQAALPGYSDRVCRISLLPTEGGLNLNMRVSTIDALVARGREAGAEIERKFTDEVWLHHRGSRYLNVMRLLQTGLSKAFDRYWELRPRLQDALPRAPEYRRPFPRRADRATMRLLQTPQHWARPPRVDFETGPEPRPESSMRITPR